MQAFLVRRRFQPFSYYTKQFDHVDELYFCKLLRSALSKEVEALEEYRPGSYHPGFLDNMYLNRYRVVHKLGYRAYSTVWLAKDCIADRYVSLNSSPHGPQHILGMHR